MDPDSKALILYLLVTISVLGICLGIALTQLPVFVREDILPLPIP